MTSTSTATPTHTPIPPTSTPFTCTNWNLAADFRTFDDDEENPNRDSCNNLGVWQFMVGSSLTRDPVNYSLAQHFTPNLLGYSDWNAWTGNSDLLWPFVSYNASSITHAGLILPDTIHMHPKYNQLVIAGWKSPVSGYVSVTGEVVDVDPSCGTGINWFIDKNASNLASGGYANGGSQTYANGTNGSNLNKVSVNTNDMLYLIIDPNGSDNCDSTRVDLLITVTTPPTSTPTATLTNTPTATFTPTLTLTSTPTITLTSTPPPNYGGNGICWASNNSWSSYTVTYVIDRNTIPTSFGWDTSINSAAQSWNNVAPSHFEFVYSTNSNNVISYGQTQNQFSIAETSLSPLLVWINIVEKSTVLNSALDWDTNNTPDTNNPDSNGSTSTYNVQNAMTHEFGHWLDLSDISDEGCSRVTMWHSGVPGEIKKITLENADEYAINWQYP